MNTTQHKAIATVASLALLGGPALAACSGAQQPPSNAKPAKGSATAWTVTACGTYSGTGCAPTGTRVDLRRPVFSHPTRITNPLFPASRTRQVVQLGHVGAKPFRSETTLLPRTGTVVWGGQRIHVVLVQYLAFLDGRIEELAVDRYAQADDGSVWYLGEDVFDYRHGAVSASEGTWLAGRDAPPSMIMPARPVVGDTYRSENTIGVVFEEMRVKAVGRSLPGPVGTVRGAITVDELHLDGAHTEKVLAPGYGEFSTKDGADVEGVAVAAPTDAVTDPLPTALRDLTTSAWGLLESARLDDWEAATATSERMRRHWATLAGASPPPLVAEQTAAAVRRLDTAVGARRPLDAQQAAIDVAQSALDLQLRYDPVSRVDVERFHLHAQQLRVHAASSDVAGTSGEVATLEWLADRIPLSPYARRQVNTSLRGLRWAADTKNLPAAADHAGRVAAQVRSLA